MCQYFCQMSSKSNPIILSYTVLKFACFLRHSVIVPFGCKIKDIVCLYLLSCFFCRNQDMKTQSCGIVSYREFTAKLTLEQHARQSLVN